MPHASLDAELGARREKGYVSSVSFALPLTKGQAMAMKREELERLRDSAEVRNFNARWRLMGGETRHEGCRGVVEKVGAPADSSVVLVRV